jgi:hypothetical protein
MFLAALPPIGLAPLGWVCFVPLFIAVHGKGTAIGFVSALVGAMLSAYLSTSTIMPGTRLEDGVNGWN